MPVQIAWALNDKSQFVHIADTTDSDKWTCPACGSEVIPRKGEVNAHHFSHKADTHCSSESVIHALAKSIIMEAASRKEALKLPALFGTVSLSHTPEEKWSVYPVEIKKTLHNAKPEVSLSSVRFDVLATIEHLGQLAIEIAVHHRKSREDIYKIQVAGKPCIEIYLDDVSWNVSYQELKQHVLNSANRVWLYSPEAERAKQQAVIELERTFGLQDTAESSSQIPVTTDEKRESAITDKDRLIGALNTGNYANVRVIPVLSSAPPKFTVNGKTYQSLYRAKYTPKLQGVNDIKKTSYGWRASLTIKSEKPGKPSLNIPYIMIESDPPELNAALSEQKVMAITEISSRQKDAPFQIVFINVGAWIEKLDIKTMKGHERYKQVIASNEEGNKK